ncbi:glycosyltransferase [Thomasclavelia sp.]|uniref:glycosyltransferase n=1 Tax=Thomasclavelia sp. TaxID=3025757 RepID=UPI0025D9661C|nr:glycosyltransferase [Thomasclavelia sp.]
MIILFDLYNAQPIGTSKFHGGGEYIKTIFKNVVDKIGNSFDKNVEISVFFNKQKYLDDWIIEIIKYNDIIVHNVVNKEDIQKLLLSQSYDVFYTGMPYMYDNIDLSNIKYKTCTIHGLRDIEKIYDKYSFFYLNNLQIAKIVIKILMKKIYVKKQKKKYSDLIEKFDCIITDSNHSKYAILVRINYSYEYKIKMMFAPNKYLEIKNIQNSNYFKKYFLLIGGNRWEKNSYRAIRAFELLFSMGLLNEYKVIVVGNLPQKIVSKIKYNKYIFKDYVDTIELENLYYNCDVFVYPTLNEGFGMPPLEAMKYGKTCIVSCVCSLQEVCGDAVYYVNPYDIEEIANRILKSTKEKIEKSKIFLQYKKIYERQENDLNLICKCIVEGEKNDTN